MNEEAKAIYRQIIGRVNNPVGACAMLANIQSECAFNSKLVEKARRGEWTDETYTKAVDDGTMSREEFAKDKRGYGLCQWTWWERKAALYDFCKKYNKSIGDRSTQVEFMLREIVKYTTPCLALKCPGYNSLEKCTRIIMLKYEAPANQSEASQLRRVTHAKELWEDLQKEGLV